jgi:hypothetical protein
VETEETVTIRQQFDKHEYTGTRTHEVRKHFWETMFSMLSVLSVYSVAILDNDFNYNEKCLLIS